MAILRNVFVLFLLLISFSFAVDITSCTNLSYPGYYILKNSVSGVNVSALPVSVPACIFINSSDVTFSCGDEISRYSISADASIASSRGVLVLNSSSGALTNVTVANCTSGDLSSGIQGYDFGFDTSFSQVTFKDSNVYNTTYGVQVDSNEGNRVEFLNLTILNSTSLSSTTGLFVSYSSNVLIENNSFLNLRSPVTISGSNFTNFTSNFLNNSIEPGLSGVVSVVLGQDILISSNNLSYTNASTLPAIRFASTEYSTVSDNRLTYDQGNPISYGIDLSTSSHNNNVTNNYVLNYTRGIILGNGVENNTVSGNTILNATYGIRFGTAQISTISSNNISNSNFSIAFITSSSSSASGLVTINSNSLSNGDAGIYLYENVYNTSSSYIINVSNNFAHNFTNGYYVRMTNASIYLNNNTANRTSNAGFYYGRSYANSSYNRATNPLGDGYVINGSVFRSYFYHNNVTNPFRNGFVILDSANTSILGGNISGSLIGGIFVNQSANTTINQTLISGSFVTGLWLLAAPDSTTLDSIHFYNNPLALRVNHSGAGASASLLLSNVIFDSPSGSLQNYSNVSLYDQLAVSEEYTMNWSEIPDS
jgi:parallel beta-helix repeat protein